MKRSEFHDKCQLSHIGYITAIEPGETHPVSWNNAAAQRVWAFSVNTMIAPKNLPSPRIEVTRRDDLLGEQGLKAQEGALRRLRELM